MWVAHQRQFHKQLDAGKRCDGMNADRIKLLEDIGFKWTVYVTVGWDAMYEQLKDFKKLNRHTNVSRSDPNNKVRVYFYCDCHCKILVVILWCLNDDCLINSFLLTSYYSYPEIACVGGTSTSTPQEETIW